MTKFSCTDCVAPLSAHTANAETGSTGHFMSFSDASVLSDIQHARHPVSVTLPDGTIATSTHTASLNIPSLPVLARHVHLFPNWIGSLLSIGLLCDCGLTAVYTATTVTLSDSRGAVVLAGTRSALTKNIWLIDLPGPSDLATTAAVITEATGTHQQIVDFYLAAMGSCAVTTLERALSASYLTLPGLDVAMLRKYGSTSVASAKGHLDQSRQGMRSTKVPDMSFSETDDDRHPPIIPRSSRTLPVLTKVLYFDHPPQTRYSDLCGRFPVTSVDGNAYLMVMICSNYIHLELMKSRDQKEFVRAYRAGTAFFDAHDIHPEYERLDNETSKSLEAYCKQANIRSQYVPPGAHQANRAERAIRTTKNHFIACLSTTDPTFPLNAWDQLCGHVELTLNLLRSSAFSPNISAWHALHGVYAYDRTPIAPPGIKILSYEPPDRRASWAAHGVEGFYVGPALQHYRSYTVYIPSTQRTRVTATLSWHPPPLYRLPGASPYDDLISCITRLRASFDSLVQSPAILHRDRQPLAAVQPSFNLALDSLVDIFRPRLPESPATFLSQPSTPSPPFSVPSAAPAFSSCGVPNVFVDDSLCFPPLPPMSAIPPSSPMAGTPVAVPAHTIPFQNTLPVPSVYASSLRVPDQFIPVSDPLLAVVPLPVITVSTETPVSSVPVSAAPLRAAGPSRRGARPRTPSTRHLGLSATAAPATSLLTALLHTITPRLRSSSKMESYSAECAVLTAVISPITLAIAPLTRLICRPSNSCATLLFLKVPTL